MSNPDRAVELARFLHTEANGMSSAEIQAETVSRWPDLTQDEVQRGVKIAMEILQAETDEAQAEVDAIRAELARRGTGR